MPLIENIKIVINKYDLKSYSSSCRTFFQYDEDEIFFMLVNDKEREGKDPADIARDLYEKGKKHSSIRASYYGNSLKEFNHVLSRVFKLK